MASFHFKKIELEHEYDPDLRLCDSVSIFESMLTSVSLPDLDPIPEPTLISVPIHLEHEPLMLASHIPLMKNECKFNSLIWTQLLNQIRLSNLNLL